jgi:signal transduction histidine kinase
MSHEIRTPLNGIIIYSFVDEVRIRKSVRIYVDDKWISDFNADCKWCFDFSKIESGKLELNIEEVNLVY